MNKGKEAKVSLYAPCAKVLLLVLVFNYPLAMSSKCDEKKLVAKISLKFVGEYKGDQLEAVSSDGRLMVLFQTSSPMRTYTYRPGKGVSRDQPVTHDEFLRVVEMDSGRELNRVQTEFFPLDVRFVPGTQQVFYSEPKSRTQPGRICKLWDVKSNQTRVCLETPIDNPGSAISYLTFLDGQQALGLMSQKTPDGIVRPSLLGRLVLADCKLTALGPADPSDPKRFPRSTLSLSPSKHHLAYALSDTLDEVLIRDLQTLAVVKRIRPPAGLLFVQSDNTYMPPLDIIYTPDTRFLLIPASNTIQDRPGRKQFILFYDTKTYELAKQIDISPETSKGRHRDGVSDSVTFDNAIYKMVLSPNGRLLATARRTKDKRQAHIILYDLTSGEEIASATHPPVELQHADPFLAQISSLMFTPDGKYVLSSTYDTRVWRIENDGN